MSEDVTQNVNSEQINKSNLLVFNENVSEDANWYVVHTYSGHEKKVASLVQDKVFGRGLQDRIFKILVPTQQKIVVSEGKKRKVDERLFPGYIIVNMIMSDDAWYVVRSTKGVTGFVGTGTKPSPLPNKEVDALMKFMTMEAPKFEAKFRAGDSVKISEGPFRDFLGKIDEVNEAQGKVRVLVSVFGRETPVELDFTQISSI
jgi:transcriptional antiterminator NusG